MVAVDLPTHPVDIVTVVVLEEVPQDSKDSTVLVDMVVVRVVEVVIDRLVEDIVVVDNVVAHNFVEVLLVEEDKVVVV